jgi:outer membrane immunogenic protein
MKTRVLVAAVPLTLALMPSANAGPIATPTNASPALAAPGYNWTGIYVGGNFGDSRGHSAFTGTSINNAFTNPISGAFDTETFAGGEKLSGMFGGIQIGFNYQLRENWVLGIEADVDVASITGSMGYCSTSTTFGTIGCTSGSSRLSEIGTLRGRVGYAWDNWLVYGTGGWAWGEGSTTASITCIDVACPAATDPFTASPASSTVNLSGWVAGAGIEWAFLPNWSVRLEYLHLQFLDVAQNFTLNGVLLAGPTPFTITTGSQSNINIDTVRVGLNYLFK